MIFMRVHPMKPHYPKAIQEKTFLQPEVALATRVPNKTINNLIERGVFTPSVFDPGKGNRRIFSTADASRLLVIHQLSSLLGGYEQSEKAATFLGDWLDGKKVIRPRHFLICKAVDASTKWEMYVLSDDPASALNASKVLDGSTTVIFPFGALLTSMADQLWAPYELKRIETAEDWRGAVFVDPNEGQSES